MMMNDQYAEPLNEPATNAKEEAWLILVQVIQDVLS